MAAVFAGCYMLVVESVTNFSILILVSVQTTPKQVPSTNERFEHITEDNTQIHQDQ
jgi:hypothetical protein